MEDRERAGARAVLGRVRLEGRCVQNNGFRLEAVKLMARIACETEFSLVRFKGDAAAARAPYVGMRPLVTQDVVDVVEAILRLPAHVNVNAIEVMPVQQSFAALAVDRKT